MFDAARFGAPSSLRLAVRVLQRRPSFALVAVASLAIAIDVNATIALRHE